ncbi:PREDICTED: CUB domain-containing protein 1, partial [Cariama cristata]
VPFALVLTSVLAVVPLPFGSELQPCGVRLGVQGHVRGGHQACVPLLGAGDALAGRLQVSVCLSLKLSLVTLEEVRPSPSTLSRQLVMAKYDLLQVLGGDRRTQPKSSECVWSRTPVEHPVTFDGLLVGFSRQSLVTIPQLENVSNLTASFTISLRTVDNITVMIKLRPGVSPSCQIRVKNVIRSELKIKPGESVTFAFTCSTPEKYFVMEIQKNIDCVSGPCPFGDVHLYPLGLPRLNRTFIWDVKASTKAGLELKFSTPWLRQIEPGETCPDFVSYNINSCIDEATVNIGTFCRNGSVSRVKLLGGVVMSLHLPWDSPLTTSGFNIANRTSIKRLCIIESILNGESSITLMSPNYPLGFPEDELMTWQFVVPSNMRASVFFHNYSLSNCERKEERVEYYIPGSLSNPEVFKLSDSQPANIAGSFNLSLQGCDQDVQNPGILRLLFQVVVQHPQVDENVTHLVDLSKEWNTTVTIHFEGWPSRIPLMSEPICLICKDPRTCDRVLTLVSGAVYKISFLCKDLSRLRITAEKGISCVDLRWCQRKIYSLSVPKAITQLPIRLHKFIWKLLAPDVINIEIMSPSLKLQQHVPEQRCNTSYSYSVVSATPETELNVGVFCPGGSIEKIQMRNNITISLKTFGRGFLNESNHQDLKMSFVPHIKGKVVFCTTLLYSVGFLSVLVRAHM